MRMNNVWVFNASVGQRGATLVVSLVFLLLMTLIGLNGMQTTVLEERMSGNQRNRSLAFQSAESALRDAETALSGSTLPTFDGSDNTGLYTTTADNPSYWDTINWTDAKKVKSYSGTLTQVASPPVYIIEKLPFSSSKPGGGGSLEAGVPQSTGTSASWYRITAQGTGLTSDTLVMLQSVFRR